MIGVQRQVTGYARHEEYGYGQLQGATFRAELDCGHVIDLPEHFYRLDRPPVDEPVGRYLDCPPCSVVRWLTDRPLALPEVAGETPIKRPPTTVGPREGGLWSPAIDEGGELTETELMKAAARAQASFGNNPLNGWPTVGFRPRATRVAREFKIISDEDEHLIVLCSRNPQDRLFFDELFALAKKMGIRVQRVGHGPTPEVES